MHIHKKENTDLSSNSKLSTAHIRTRDFCPNSRLPCDIRQSREIGQFCVYRGDRTTFVGPVDLWYKCTTNYFMCKVCQKDFKSKGTLTAHEKRHRQGETSRFTLVILLSPTLG